MRAKLRTFAQALLGADGSDDDKISPEGLPMYKVPPPIDYIPATDKHYQPLTKRSETKMKPTFRITRTTDATMSLIAEEN